MSAARDELRVRILACPLVIPSVALVIPSVALVIPSVALVIPSVARDLRIRADQPTGG